MEGLRGHTSGYAVPTYVIDAPGGGGKIPVMPNYLISYSDHKVVLRNYEGYITTYEEPRDLRAARRGAPARTASTSARSPASPASSACSRASGCGSSRRASSEVHTRGNTEAHRLQDPSKWVPFGVGAIEGQAEPPLRVLEPGEVAAATDADADVRPGRGAPAARGRADRRRARGAPLGTVRAARATASPTPRRSRATSPLTHLR